VNRELESGDILINRYQIKEPCGQGGMGRVYKAYDKISEIDVAVKLVPAEVSTNQYEMEAVKENFKLIQQLNHPNIAALKHLEYIPETKEYFIVMEYVPGVNLTAYRRSRKNRVIAVDEAGRICQKAAAGLDYAHKHRVIHRDVKPENIMITPTGEVKILDFGLAMQIKTSFMKLSTQGFDTSGTQPYMAPETWLGRKQNEATDVYALGILFYEMVEGRPPFENLDYRILMEIVLKHKPELPKNLSRGQNRALAKALAKERKDRFQSAGEFARELQKEILPKPTRWKYAAAVLGVLISLAVVGAYFQLQTAARTDKIAWISKKLIDQLVENKPDAEKIPIVVGSISGETSPYPFALALSKLLDSELSLTDAFMALERRELKGVYREVGKEIGDVFDDDDIRQFGSMTNAKGILVGDFTEFGQKVRINIRLVDPFNTNRICSAYLDVPKQQIPAEFLASFGKRLAEAPPSSAEARKGTLSVHASPSDAIIRILNIAPKFHQGMELSPGRYQVEISANGYDTRKKWIELSSGEDKELEIRLEPAASASSRNNKVSTAQPTLPSSGTASKEPFTNSLGMTFVYIKPGTFMMGSPESEKGRYDDERQYKVTLTKGYYMQTTEVTQGQWQAVMGNNPSSFEYCGETCPVEKVSWEDIQEFIKKLNQRDSNYQYRLPTEAEWEYAARAGSRTAFANGGINELECGRDSNLSTMGWYCGNAGVDYKGCYDDSIYGGSKCAGPHPVAQKEPNVWGLYDMHGNVWEWCQDRYGDYPTGSVTDPQGPSSGAARVLRGGSWYYDAGGCRSADRSRGGPGLRDFSDGFRLAVSLFSR
jgi:formylglycine-generating enzyme required for sulfatase activity/serine/threonine protein kinase